MATVCAPQCSGRCFGRNPSECCHVECAGGCTGPKDTDCFACRNFNNSGSCVPQCPQTVIYNRLTYRMEPNPNAKYQYGSICVTQCPKNVVVDGSSCVSNCPSNKMEVEKNGVKTCEPCKGLCPKVCHGTSWTDSNSETVDARNIESFINCTKIQGSLNFLVTGIEGDAYNKVPPLDPEKLKIFNTVEEITGVYFLNIQSWPASMSDLSVFSNLQTIQGRKLYKSYALMVVKINSLTSLGLRSLQNINDGAVYIKGNKNLCYHDTVNWTRLLGSRPQKLKEKHVCHPLCSSDGCWGPGPDQCVTALQKMAVHHNATRLQLLQKPFRFYSPFFFCLQGANKCLVCASLKDGPHCVSMCPEGVMGQEGTIFKYPDKEGNCKPCHNNCIHLCTIYCCPCNHFSLASKILWYTWEFMVDSMTAKCPSPVAAKQAQIITPPPLCLTLGMRCLC
uniref:receptor protein-tyrosine kinase n=1 Tax=Maylandia zebra TaxID=106582 RepID=A0A3P9BP32_9CICH